ncbi:hypothetical protein O181_102557 [Austropuccinia psidii MF-1]|uniref:Uncharacterized protein n=1 Tax=Austropuccinia psidii MF-1 TaxID=1389203 RepID=A0A9Q3JI35_9BASI|nr:hypothetical protein [Austropuccinia psidii MF-1]
MVCGLWSMDPLGPFWPNPMRPKGAKGGIPLAPKARWAHMSQFLTMDSNPPILAKNSKDLLWPIFNQGPPVAHFQPWPLVTRRGHQLSSNPLFPQLKGNISHSSMQDWCI